MNTEKLTYEDLTFWARLKDYGARRIMSSWATRCSVLVYLSMRLFGGRMSNEFIIDFTHLLMTIAAAVFALEIAGFAIAITVSSEKVKIHQWRRGAFLNLYFPFWLIAFIWIIALFTGATVLVLKDIGVTLFREVFLAFVAIVAHGMLATVSVLGSIYRAAAFEAYYLTREESKNGTRGGGCGEGKGPDNEGI